METFIITDTNGEVVALVNADDKDEAKFIAENQPNVDEHEILVLPLDTTKPGVIYLNPLF